MANVVVVRLVAEPEKARLPWHGKALSGPTGAPYSCRRGVTQPADGETFTWLDFSMSRRSKL